MLTDGGETLAYEAQHNVKVLYVNYFSSFSVPSDVPLDIRATPLDSTTLFLNWSAPSEDARNGLIVQYTVNISVSETGMRFQRIVDGSGTVTLTNLHPYYEYTYIIAAATAVGTGPFSVRSSIRMPQDGVFVVLLLP